MPLCRHLGDAPYVTRAAPQNAAFPSSTNFTIAQLNKYILSVHYFYLESISIPRGHSSSSTLTTEGLNSLFLWEAVTAPNSPPQPFPRAAPLSCFLELSREEGRKIHTVGKGSTSFAPFLTVYVCFSFIILSFQTTY